MDRVFQQLQAYGHQGPEFSKQVVDTGMPLASFGLLNQPGVGQLGVDGGLLPPQPNEDFIVPPSESHSLLMESIDS